MTKRDIILPTGIIIIITFFKGETTFLKYIKAKFLLQYFIFNGKILTVTEKWA